MVAAAHPLTPGPSPARGEGRRVPTVQSQHCAATQGTIYYLLWRMRPNHPWHSQEYDNRQTAHERYFQLIELGVEVYLERRQSLRSE